MRNDILIFFFLLLTIFFSCQKEKNCANKIALTQHGKTDLTLKLNYNQSQEALREEIKNHFQEDICWEEKTIDLQINNRVLKTIFQEACIMKGTGYGIRYISEVRVLINQQGELLINDEYFLPQDSLSDWIGQNFPYELKKEFTLEEISIHWLEETPKEDIENVLLEIEEGFLKSYESISNKKFKNPICDLNQDEFLQLKKELDFRIKLSFGRIIPPPPPPPPTDEEIEENFLEY